MLGAFLVNTYLETDLGKMSLSITYTKHIEQEQQVKPVDSQGTDFYEL